MKNTCKTLFILFLCLFSSQTSFGQATGDNFVAFGKFLGYNGAGLDLDFRTNNVDRMRLMETGNSTINGYTVPVGGHLGLSLDPTFFGTGVSGRQPCSLLHLNGLGNSAGE
jgi:hypothetical protein